MPDMTRVIVVEREPLFRHGLVTVLIRSNTSSFWAAQEMPKRVTPWPTSILRQWPWLAPPLAMRRA